MIAGVGYEGITIDALVADLVERRIEVVVDVRLNAVSRKRGFSRRALAAALDVASIGYRHEPTLGNPRDNREGFRAGDSAALEAMQTRLATVGADAMARLERDARERRVAVLCFEREGERCHRRVILDMIGTA